MMKTLWTLFSAFCRIGAFTFGGGYAMLPLLEKEVVERYGWSTKEELMDYFAIGQCTPGVIAVNTATFVGFKIAGVAGGIIATLGVITPSLIIIMLIAALLQQFADLAVVQQAFAGIRVAVAVLIINTVLKLAKSSIKNPLGVFLFLGAFIAVALLDLSPVYVTLAAALVGLLCCKSNGGLTK